MQQYFLAFILFISFCNIVAQSKEQYPSKTRFKCCSNYSPFIKGLNPEQGNNITESLIKETLEKIHPYTSAIRVYSSSLGLEKVGIYSKKLGIKLIPSAWIGKDPTANKKEIEKALEIAIQFNCEILIIGSEVLYRNDLSPKELSNLLEWTKNEIKKSKKDIKLAVADVYSEFLKPDAILVTQHCQILMINAYPFWEGIEIKYALPYLDQIYGEMQHLFPKHEIWVSETGWPSKGYKIGQAEPSTQNSAYYFSNFVDWANERGLQDKAFYFSFVDEAWKPGEIEKNWGIFFETLELKPSFQEVFEGGISTDWRPKKIEKNQEGKPRIQVDYVPKLGDKTDKFLRGQIIGVQDPSEYRVQIFVFVGGQFWVKPFLVKPFIIPREDGSFFYPIITGGADETASITRIYLLKKDYQASSEIPPEKEIVALEEVFRK